MLKRTQIFIILILLTSFEAFAQTFWQAYGDKDIAAIIYVIAGVLIGLLPLLKIKENKTAHNKDEKITTLFHKVVLLFCVAFIGCFGWLAIQNQLLDYTFADMLPIIKIMGERWLNGGEVYAVIPEIWDGMQPIYLPMMWLPYTPAVLMDIDIRFVNLVFIGLAVFLAMRGLDKKAYKNWSEYLILLPVGILLTYILIDYSTLITVSEEPIVVGFYAILGYFLIKEKHYGFAAALVFCVLSRYTLIFWAVVHIMYIFLKGERNKALIISSIALVLGVLIMVMSQGILELELFYSLKDSYLETLTDPANEWGVMNTVNNNIGLARLAGYENLVFLHRLLFWGSLILPAGLYFYYHYKLRNYIHFGLFALCSLKLCLVYFFNVNPMPYSYLFYTSTFLSLIIVGHFTLTSNSTASKHLS